MQIFVVWSHSHSHKHTHTYMYQIAADCNQSSALVRPRWLRTVSFSGPWSLATLPPPPLPQGELRGNMKLIILVAQIQRLDCIHYPYPYAIQMQCTFLYRSAKRWPSLLSTPRLQYVHLNLYTHGGDSIVTPPSAARPPAVP